MLPIGLLLLAAGASSRLGRPKQLLPYQGQPLLRHLTEMAILSQCQPIVIILGAQAETIQVHLTDLPTHHSLDIIHNPDWSTGMASSIRFGLTHLCTIASDLAAVVLMLCDQPFVTPALLNQLIALYNTGYPLVASAYADSLGVPALFDRTYFAELAALQGDTGARRLIQQYRSTCGVVQFPEGAIDLDTAADYEFLCRRL